MRSAVIMAIAMLAATQVGGATAATAQSIDPLAARPAVSVEAQEPATVTVIGRAVRPTQPDVFGTVALDAGVTVYDARWRRVSAADERDPRLLAIAARLSGLDPAAKIALIQAEVRRRVSWRRDLDVYHVSDYWAQAGETLDRGMGDSEDIAILKMQLLKAAGFSPRDIYLSVGRDSTRGADTLLLVRAGDAFFALDDRSEAPLSAVEQARFTPVITLGKGIAWLHGHRVGTHAARTGKRIPIPATAAAPSSAASARRSSAPLINASLPTAR